MWCEEEKEDGEEKKEREDEEEKKGDEGAAELLVRCSNYFFDSPLCAGHCHSLPED